MNLENRIAALEDKIGCNDEPGPLVMIKVTDFSKHSQDQGVLQMITIPGKPGGPPGVTLNRGENEDPDSFLKKCEKKHSEFYAS